MTLLASVSDNEERREDIGNYFVPIRLRTVANFLEVLEKIGETPGEKIPLAVDSTHLNWHGSKNLQNVQVPRKVFF